MPASPAVTSVLRAFSSPTRALFHPSLRFLRLSSSRAVTWWCVPMVLCIVPVSPLPSLPPPKFEAR